MKYRKAAKGLGILNNAHQSPVIREKYPVIECFNVLRNLWAKPEVKELIITSHAWAKLMAFIHLIGDYEISGFGKIERREDTPTTFYVTDFDIIKQTVEGAYVESDEDAVMDFIMRTPADQREQWTLDWHSHVNMGTTPSGTDWSNYGDMLSARMGKQFPAIVVNKQGNVSAYQIMTEARHETITVKLEQEDIPEGILLQIYKECKEKVENLCTKKQVIRANTAWAGSKNLANNYNSKRWWDTYNTYEEEDDDDIAAAKAQGYVFDEEDACEYCDELLVTAEEKQNKCCSNCYREITLGTGRFA